MASPSDEDTVVRLLEHPGRPLIARGLGRSYGDAAQSSGGLVVETARLSWIGELDEETGCIEVGGGVSLHHLLQEVIPRGWFVAVTPGTRHVSVGGAIASDIHGKNHHCDGSFARHVTTMTLATPVGRKVVTPDDDAELFWATAGGMGLTGVVVRATLRLIPIETSWMQVENRRFTTLGALMSAMEQSDEEHRYSVAWLDCLASRDGRRRSILTLGGHAPLSVLPERLRARRLESPGETRLRVPVAPPVRMANRLSVRLLNEGWFRVSSHGSLVALRTYFHPLDGIGGWNVLYGPEGFVQYQFAVPLERGDVVEEAVECIAASGVPSFLAVLKRFGPGTPGPLSFAQSGWTLALDFPVGPAGLSALLDALDERVAAAGGRVYLAKDARLRPELVPVMYPRLGELRAVRQRVDPRAVLTSDLSRRLGL
ncbi:MAG TPA: FAD-binding oxidoreductase [Acidimicrobiales bacterium]|nr:FAD-binding oxidoreductase [Acidimicrobiales bacterium]